MGKQSGVTGGNKTGDGVKQFTPVEMLSSSYDLMEAHIRKHGFEVESSQRLLLEFLKELNGTIEQYDNDLAIMNGIKARFMALVRVSGPLGSGG